MADLGSHRSPTDLFGNPIDDSSPLWFKSSSFLSPSFDPESYINDLKSFVPLESLAKELRSHLSSLKSELVDLINRDYADFVSLSTRLVDVDSAVARMRAPIVEFREKVLGFREAVDTALGNLREGLRQRAEAAAAREVLELLLDTFHVVSKVEKLIKELPSMPADGSTADIVHLEKSTIINDTSLQRMENGTTLRETQSLLLERIASEMNRLKFYISHAKNLPFIENMEKRIQSATLLLDGSLGHCFVNGLEHRDATAIYNCLRAYAAIDNTSAAEEIFRTTIVAPLIQKIIPYGTQVVDGASSDELEEDYQQIKQCIEKDCKFLLEISSSANSGFHVFDFLANSILKEVLLAIQKGKPGAFSPGRPTEFLKNYKSSLGFLAFLEGYCPSRSAVSKLRSEAVYTDFMRQWNVGVYFSLRFQEIAGSLDSALMVSTITPVDNKQGKYPKLKLKQSITLLETLRSCWSEDVLVISCSDKFLRLSLQLLSRYSTWLSSGLAARKGDSTLSNSTPNSEWAVVAQIEDFIYPLEGLSETVPEPGQLPSQAAIPTSKATVPCYFYYNAYCIKGEQCPFLHEILPAQKFQKAAPEATIVHHPPETKASAGSDTRPASIEVPANSPGDTLEVIKQEHSKEVIQQPAPGIASEEHSPSAESSVPDHEEPGIKLSDDNPLPPTEYVNGSPELCPGQGSDENAKDSAEADEWWESSPGFDVLVDDGSEQLAYEEDGDYLLAQERESEMLHGRLLQYDYEVPPGYDPLAYPDSGFLYEQGIYDGYDHADNKYNPEYFHKVSEHLSERRNLEPTSHRKRKPSRRRHDVVDDRDVMDLRDHLRKRRRTDRSPHKRYSSRTRGSSRERSGRRGMVPLLHGRLVSEVGNNMHVSAQSDTESALNDSHGKGWSGYPQSTRHAQSRLREREYRRRNRKPQLVLSSEVLPRSASRRTESSQIKSGAVTFSGPKTLAQIKEEKRRAREADGNSFESHTPQNFRRSRSIDFEGPKPLNELLKDKKRSGSSNGNENGLAGMSGEEQHSSGDKELRHSETLEKQSTGYESDFVDDDGEDEDEDEDALHEKLVRMLSS